MDFSGFEEGRTRLATHGEREVSQSGVECQQVLLETPGSRVNPVTGETALEPRKREGAAERAVSEEQAGKDEHAA